MLDNRKKKILQAIVEEYIDKAEPVSSKSITENYGLDYSSATIRNEMAELEKVGYLEKTHTSSGRVPSVEGYRYYVNELLNTDNISIKEIEYIKSKLETRINQLEDLTKITTSTLSEITHYTSVGIGPNMELQEIKELQFILLGKNILMAIIFTKQGLIKETVIKFDKDINKNQVSLISKLFNERLVGRPLTDIDKPFEEYMFLEMENILEVVKPIVEELKKIIKESLEVYMEGTNKSFELPELQKSEVAKEFINILDLSKNNQMFKILEEKSKGNEINVYIGGETSNSLKDFSIITLKNNVDGEDLGTIAIIGPKRMNYSKVISAMKFISKEIKDKNKLLDKPKDRKEK